MSHQYEHVWEAICSYCGRKMREHLQTPPVFNGCGESLYASLKAIYEADKPHQKGLKMICHQTGPQHRQWIQIANPKVDMIVDCEALETVDFGGGDHAAYHVGFGPARVVRIGSHSHGSYYHCLVEFVHQTARGVQPSCE